MPEYTGTVQTPRSVEEAFAYMADFTHTAEWDPSCESATQLTPGEVGLGTRYELVFEPAGQQLRLQYEVTTFEPPHRIVLEGGNDSVRSTDTITVEPAGAGGGASVTYDADLGMTGAKKLLQPLVAVGFKRASEKARKSLQERLAA
jgi:uncharacterized protein YndB with AHSA1/START domain